MRKKRLAVKMIQFGIVVALLMIELTAFIVGVGLMSIIM